MLLNLILMMIGKKLLLLLMFISLVSFGQDKFTGLGGYLTVTENNIWIFSYQNNEYKQLKDRASIAFDNKNDVEEFINNYIDCISNIKTIENVKYTISSTKKGLHLCKPFCSSSKTRTLDPLINSQML